MMERTIENYATTVINVTNIINLNIDMKVKVIGNDCDELLVYTDMYEITIQIW